MRRAGLDILLVEDNLGDARLIEVLLAEEAGADFRITRADRLSGAVDTLAAGRFDVILLDLSLPDSQGLSTVDAVRARAGNIPIVVLSGLDDEEMALKALQSGAQDYLVKGRADGTLIKRAILYALERQRIRQRVLLAEAAFSATDTGIMVMDSERKVIRVNPAFTRLTGYPQEDVEGHLPHMLGCGENPDDFHETMFQDVDPVSGWEGELWNRRSSGGIYPVWVRVNAVSDETGSLSGYVVVLSDITRRKQLEAELVRQATRDPLTGLPNRTLLLRILAEAVENARQPGAMSSALLFVDLDGFKDVNDTYGHEAGDAVLKEVARRLRALLRASDEVARLAGDEFVVVLGDVRHASDACKVADKIVESVAMPYQLADGQARISASVGIALAPDDALTPDRLLQCADAAMYKAKKAGKNRWRYWTDSDQSAERVTA